MPLLPVPGDSDAHRSKTQTVPACVPGSPVTLERETGNGGTGARRGRAGPQHSLPVQHPGEGRPTRHTPGRVYTQPTADLAGAGSLGKPRVSGWAVFLK